MLAALLTELRWLQNHKNNKYMYIYIFTFKFFFFNTLIIVSGGLLRGSLCQPWKQVLNVGVPRGRQLAQLNHGRILNDAISRRTSPHLDPSRIAGCHISFIADPIRPTTMEMRFRLMGSVSVILLWTSSIRASGKRPIETPCERLELSSR